MWGTTNFCDLRLGQPSMCSIRNEKNMSTLWKSCQETMQPLNVSRILKVWQGALRILITGLSHEKSDDLEKTLENMCGNS